MARTPDIINASKFGLFIDPTTPALLTDRLELNVNFKQDIRDITTADSLGFEESAEGLRSTEISGSVDVDMASANNLDDLMAAFLAKTLLLGEVKTANADDPEWAFSCYLFQLSITTGVEDTVKANFTLKVDGAITYTPPAV